MKKASVFLLAAMLMGAMSSDEFASVGKPFNPKEWGIEESEKPATSTNSTRSIMEQFQANAKNTSGTSGSSIRISDECDYQIVFFTGKDGRAGCAIDEKIAVPPVFSSVRSLNCEESLFVVMKNRQLGLVKAFGKDYIVPCEFSEIDADVDRRLLYLRKAGENFETYSLDTGKKWEGTEIWPPKNFPVKFQLKDLTDFPYWTIDSVICRRVGGLNTLGRRGANNGFEFRVKGVGVQNWSWQGPAIRASFVYIEMSFEKEDGSLKKFSDNTAFPSVSAGKPFELVFFASDRQLKDINPAGIVLKSIHHNPNTAVYGSNKSTATGAPKPMPQEKAIAPEKVNIPKKTLAADYNSLLKQPRITASERTTLKIDAVNDEDLVDLPLNKHENSNLVKGEVIYQNKTGKLATVHVIAEDHAAQTHLLSYDASGNYIDHILVSYHFIYRGDNRSADIQGDKISVTEQWGDCEEDCTSTYEVGITSDFKFVKKNLNQTNEAGIATSATTSVPIDDHPATLHLYRKRSLLGGILPTRYDVLLDNAVVGSSTNNWKTTVKVTTSGTKTVSATIDGRKATVQINFEPGGVYYICSDIDSKLIDTGKKDKNGKAVKDIVETPTLQVVDKNVGESEFNRIK